MLKKPMSKVGTAQLPLHGGKAPAYLFSRMTKLAREISLAIIHEYGTVELMQRLSDPYWFQAFGCVLGYDWHSSGVTTVVCGALKEAWKPIWNETGLYIAGGKGGTSRKTPSEILARGQDIKVSPDSLVYASRMSAKVDNNALQDGYQIYHHSFLFDREGRWAVIQQGMNETNGYARRYHWLSETVSDFVDEPHAGIIAADTTTPLNMTAHESDASRTASVQLSLEKPWKTLRELKRIQRAFEPQAELTAQSLIYGGEPTPDLDLPAHHSILTRDLNPDRIAGAFEAAYETQPQNFEELLGVKNVGPKTIRALALLSEIVYGAKPSFTDPARFSFAHGGKDKIPYAVDRTTYDRSIHILHTAVEKAKIGEKERLDAIKRLQSSFLSV
jgi:hypothetical protein